MLAFALPVVAVHLMLLKWKSKGESSKWQWEGWGPDPITTGQQMVKNLQTWQMCSIAKTIVREHGMEEKMLWPARTIVFQTAHVFCSGFRRIRKERSYSAQLSELIFDQECCSRGCQMLSLFLRQDTKTKTRGTDRRASIVRAPIQISAATRSAALMPACRGANAVLLQHVKEVLEVSLLVFYYPP